MKIGKSELINILSKMKEGLSSSDIVEQMQYLIFNEENIVTFNQKIAIFYPLKFNFKCAVKFDIFYDFVKSISGEFIDINLNDGVLLLSSGKTNIKLSVSNIDINILKNLKTIKIKSINNKFFDLPKDFKKYLNSCVPFISKDFLSTTYNLYLDNNTILCGDDQRYHKINVDFDKKLDRYFLIANTNVNSLVRFELEKMFYDNKWIYFKTSDKFIVCTVYDTDDWGTEDILPLFKENVLEFNITEDLMNILPFLQTIYKYDKNGVNFNINGNIIKISYDGKIGKLDEEIIVQSKIKNMSFGINPINLYEILNLFKFDKIGVSENLIVVKSDQVEHIIAHYS